MTRPIKLVVQVLGACIAFLVLMSMYSCTPHYYSKDVRHYQWVKDAEKRTRKAERYKVFHRNEIVKEQDKKKRRIQ